MQVSNPFKSYHFSEQIHSHDFILQMKNEEELKNRIKMLEIEKEVNQQTQESEDKKKIQELEGELAKIKDDKVCFYR